VNHRIRFDPATKLWIGVEVVFRIESDGMAETVTR
jgi:hypothetical protein